MARRANALDNMLGMLVLIFGGLGTLFSLSTLVFHWTGVEPLKHDDVVLAYSALGLSSLLLGAIILWWSMQERI